jgi:hypothetical protein
LTVSNASGASVASGTSVKVNVGGFTNPTNPNTTFYARILTYATATTGYTDSGTIASAVDAGGVALSTTSQISVSGTVQETLTFCVSGEAITDCTVTAPPTLELGHGDPKVLDTTDVDKVDAFSQISTNAGGGASIRIKNSNSCAGLMRAGAADCDIASVASSGSPITIANGEAKFGLQVVSSGGNMGTLTTAGDYAGTGDAFGLDADVTSTYGSVVASSDGVLDGVNTTYTFGAGASNTTPAGVYTATMTLIATGTY